MGILIDTSSTVLVQGITGREGRTRTRLMKEFGTNVVAGVTPGKGGEKVEGIPVYNSVADAVKNHGRIDASVLFVPAPLVKDAALEAFSEGVKLIHVVPDRVPLYDAMAILRSARKYEASFIGPNSLGVLNPGRALIGMIGGNAGSASQWFKKGPVGITSRSGGLTTSTAYYLNRAGIGQSTIVHVGGDSLIGMPHPDIVKLFEKDDETEIIVMLGEIGGNQEERVAECIVHGEVTKPVVAYIGGKGAKNGTRFSHAGAIIEGGKGTYQGKVDALRNAGAEVVDDIMKIPDAVAAILRKGK